MWSLVKKFKTYLASAGIIILSMAYVFWKGFTFGKSQVVQEAQKAKEKAIEKRKTTENETKSLDDASLDRDNSRWVRK